MREWNGTIREWDGDERVKAHAVDFLFELLKVKLQIVGKLFHLAESFYELLATFLKVGKFR